jgi:acetolactate synthase-1/2/3 large subunit
MRVKRLADVPEVMAKAFRIARSGRPGPVHVELPRVADYSEFVLQENPEPLPAYKPVPVTVVKPDPQDIDRFARPLMDARRPVIAAGKGVIRAGAMADLAALAEQLQAPVIFAQDTIGVISEDPPSRLASSPRSSRIPCAPRC